VLFVKLAAHYQKPLQDSLGGNSHAVMVVNINALRVNFLDTYHSLTFASKSKNSASPAFSPNRAQQLITHLDIGLLVCSAVCNAWC